MKSVSGFTRHHTALQLIGQRPRRDSRQEPHCSSLNPSANLFLKVFSESPKTSQKSGRRHHCCCQVRDDRAYTAEWAMNHFQINSLANDALSQVPAIKRRNATLLQAASRNEVATEVPLRPLEDLKRDLMGAVEGIELGIFGVPSSKKEEIELLIEELERHNPCEQPTNSLDKVAGEWTLLYSTIKILGSRRTKLGLREFVKLGSFRQIIDIEKSQASNIIDFRVTGLGVLTGSLTIDASYKPVSPKRVEIKFLRSVLVPEQLLLLFRKNYDLLLSIFNPEGWLDITFVDDELRVGRDDKDNVFLLKR